MHWINLFVKLLIPLGMTIYTINFGRWMGRRKHKAAAFGAYLISVVAMGLSAFIMIRNSL
jgi:hypothetical protein